MDGTPGLERVHTEPTSILRDTEWLLAPRTFSAAHVNGLTFSAFALFVCLLSEQKAGTA